MSELFEDLVNYSWERHGHNMPTCRLPQKFDSNLRNIFKLPLDAYIMLHNLNPVHLMQPNEIPYLTRWHIDLHRKSAIFIPVSLDNENHYTEFMYNNSKCFCIEDIFPLPKKESPTNKNGPPSKLAEVIIEISD